MLRWTHLNPPAARHALRNAGDTACRLLVVTTASLGDFFAEIGRPVIPGEPPPLPDTEWIGSFMQAAASRGFWSGSPEENEAIGLKV